MSPSRKAKVAQNSELPLKVPLVRRPFRGGELLAASLSFLSSLCETRLCRRRLRPSFLLPSFLPSFLPASPFAIESLSRERDCLPFFHPGFRGKERAGMGKRRACSGQSRLNSTVDVMTVQSATFIPKWQFFCVPLNHPLLLLY